MKKFLPLISIFAAIFVFTAYMHITHSGGDMLYTMRMFMGSFFVVFGAFKVVNLKGFAMAYREYDLLAKRSWIYAYLYPFIELGLGAAFLAGTSLQLASIITLIVMSIGALGVFLKLIKREQIMCACLGVVFKVPMTWVTLLEDVVMAGMALWMLPLL